MFSSCLLCKRNKKKTKSKLCHTCARNKQHADGVYSHIKQDLSSGYKYCNYCKKSHPIIENSSNDFWLLRKSKSRIRYECKIYREMIYQKNRLNPRNRLRKAVSNLIRDCIAKQHAFKSGSFPKYVSWTVEELKAHLESKFQPGMTWENYGEWHIDHVIPDSWFNYSSMDDQDFQKSWSLDNLQPMWARDNTSKGNRFKGGY